MLPRLSLVKTPLTEIDKAIGLVESLRERVDAGLDLKACCEAESPSNGCRRDSSSARRDSFSGRLTAAFSSSKCNPLECPHRRLLTEIMEDLILLSRSLSMTSSSIHSTFEQCYELKRPPPAMEKEFPMITMPIQSFQQLDALEAYATARAAGNIDKVDAAAIVHFVSHEWITPAHPDPEGVQLRILQRFFKKAMLKDGIDDVFSKEDWQAFSSGSANKTHAIARRAAAQIHRAAGDKPESECTPENFVRIFNEDVSNGSIWMDWFSIPQITIDMSEDDRRATHVNQLRAISSIPSYIQRSTYFYVCAPTVKHQNGRMNNFDSWNSRGWCRLESFANFLSPEKTMMPVVLTEAPKVSFLEFFDFFLFRASRPEFSVFNGNFKCCSTNHVIDLPGGRAMTIQCDKDLLQPVLAQLFDQKVERLRDAGNDFLYRIFKCMEPAILAGSRNDRTGVVCSPSETVPQFLERFLLPDDPKLGDNSGAPAIEWAAFAGHAPMVEKLLALGCPADVADKGGLTPLLGASLCSDAARVVRSLLKEGGLSKAAINAPTKGLGISPLDRAAKGGLPDIVKMLINAQADVESRRSNGCTPLLSAAMNGHLSVCKTLLASGADVGAVNEEGEGVLHVMAKNWALAGRPVEDRERVMRLLLAARAETALQDKAGRTAFEFSATLMIADFTVALQRAMVTERDDSRSSYASPLRMSL